MKTHIQLAIYTRIFPTYCACQRINVKRKGEDHHDSCIKYKTRIKDRPFAEGSRGCHVLLWLDAQNPNAKERHFILPLVIWTFIMQSVTFISSISQDCIKLSFSALISHAYLERNFYCLHRWQLTWWILLNPYVGMVYSHGKTGLRVFGSTSSISTWCNEFG